MPQPLDLGAPFRFRIPGGHPSARPAVVQISSEAESQIKAAPDVTFATFDSGLTFSGLQWVAPVRFQATLRSGGDAQAWKSEEFKGTCTWSSGIYVFAGQLPESPLCFEFKLKGAADEEVSSIRFHFNLEPWKGRRISALPAFDELFALADGIHVGGALHLECWGPLGHIVSARPHKNSGAFFGRVRELLVPLADAREIGRTFGVDPVLEGPLTDDQLSEIDLLHALSRTNEYRETARGIRLSMRLGKEGIRALLADPAGNASGAIRLHQEKYLFPFLGTYVVGRNATFELTHAVLASDAHTLRQQFEAADAAGLDVSYVGEDGAELIVRVQSLEKAPRKQSVLDLLRSIPGGRLFKTGRDVDEYLDRERDAWEE